MQDAHILNGDLYVSNGEFKAHSPLGGYHGKMTEQRRPIAFDSKHDLARNEMLINGRNSLKNDSMMQTLHNYTKDDYGDGNLFVKTMNRSDVVHHHDIPFDAKILNDHNVKSLDRADVLNDRPNLSYESKSTSKRREKPSEEPVYQNLSFDGKPIENDRIERRDHMLRGLLNKDKAKKDRKVLHPQAKELILNVVNFMKQEANGEFVVPARKVQCRAAMATGFSERTVRRVVKESKSLPVTENSNGEGSSVSFPPKKAPNRPKPKTGLDSLTLCAVRKIIHRIYVNEKTVPTIKKIHQKLVEEIGFKGGSRSAHKIVKELGFYWKKTKAKSYVLMEKHEIRLKRIEYLRDMTRFRHEGRPIVYVAETILPCRGSSITAITSGNERGFVTGSLFAMENQSDLVAHAAAWVRESLLLALPPCTVVVLDGVAFAGSHERVPTLDCDAETMKHWLTSKGIPHRSDMLRPELHQVIRRHAGRIRKHKSVVEQLLAEAGHTVVRIPSDHPDLNPAALIWADVRRAVVERGSGNASESRAIAEVRLAELGAEAWDTRCAHVRSVEQQYLASEGIVDAEVERVLAAGKDPATVPEEPEDPHDNNINFVRHFMGGLLGLDEHKLYSA